MPVSPSCTWRPAEQREHRRAHGPQVRPPVDLVPARQRLLGRHEGGRAQHRARRASTWLARLAGLEHPRDAEVEHLEPPVRVTKRFSGLMSRWMTPLACAAASTSSSWSPIASTSRDGQALPPRALPALLERLALEQLHHEERRAVGGHVVVEHAHRARVLEVLAAYPSRRNRARFLVAGSARAWSIFTATRLPLRCVAA